MPEPWAKAARDKGYVRTDGGANLSALARAAGTNLETTRRLVQGRGKSGDDVIAKVAAALGRPVHEVAAWAKVGRQLSEPYRPPQEANRLSRRQREALDRLIKSIVDPGLDVTVEIEEAEGIVHSINAAKQTTRKAPAKRRR